MSRTTHRLGQETCNGCCLTTKPFSGTNGEDVDTRVNIVTYTTSSSCCFEIFDTTALYLSVPVPVPIPTTSFETNPFVPNAVLFAPSLNKGVVLSFTSFSVTNLYTGDTTEYIPRDNTTNNPIPLQIAVGRPGLSPPYPNGILVLGSDSPEITLSGKYAFGSFDKVLSQIFQLIDPSGGGFQSLTNPNEHELGKPNVTQIIWPGFLKWSLTWINFDNVQYTLAADHAAIDANNSPYGSFTCTTTKQNLPPTADPTPSQTIQLCNTAWDVPCHPTGYVSARHSFDFNFPCVPGTSGCSGNNIGCTGLKGPTGVFCIDDFVIDNRPINFTRDCVCAQFLDDTLVEQPSNQGKLVNALNILFKISKAHGWKAISDIEYGYIRIIHPDNILTWSIKLNKTFYDLFGNVLPFCVEFLTFKQGAKTEKTKINSSGDFVTTANNACILKLLCWVMESDKNGYFLTR